MEIKDVEPKLSDGDPIKVLTQNYLMDILRPEGFNYQSVGYEKFKEVLFHMLDIAYRFGVYEAVGAFQQVVWTTGQNNGQPILDIRDVCEITEDYLKKKQDKIDVPSAEDLMKWES